MGRGYPDPVTVAFLGAYTRVWSSTYNICPSAPPGRPKRDFGLAFAPTRYRAEERGRTRGMDDKCMPCRPSRSVRPPPRPQGVFDLTQARLATNFRRRSIPPRVILYEPRTPDLTQSHECKHTWDSRVGVWHEVLTSCGGLPPATSRRPTLLLLGCVLLLRLGTLLLLRLGTLH